MGGAKKKTVKKKTTAAQQHHRICSIFNRPTFAADLWWLKSKLLVKGALKRRDASRECGSDCDTPSFELCVVVFFWSQLKYLLRLASVMTE